MCREDVHGGCGACIVHCVSRSVKRRNAPPRRRGFFCGGRRLRGAVGLMVGLVCRKWDGGQSECVIDATRIHQIHIHHCLFFSIDAVTTYTQTTSQTHRGARSPCGPRKRRSGAGGRRGPSPVMWGLRGIEIGGSDGELDKLTDGPAGLCWIDVGGRLWKERLWGLSTRSPCATQL